jgi:hypothetical protein
MLSSARRIFALVNRTFFRPERLRADSIEPVGRSFGRDRGTPIDRYYIERFLDRNRDLIRGKVLEIAENTYSQRFGGAAVTNYEILHVVDHPNATIVGDLTNSATLPADCIDCFICTQTFNFIYDFRSAIHGAHHLLAPGGVMLATVSGISQISAGDAGQWGDYWRFTPQSTKRAFEDIFGQGNVTVDFDGNCLAATSLLRGLALEEMDRSKLDVKDAEYPITITVIARKAEPGKNDAKLATPLAALAGAWEYAVGAVEGAIGLGEALGVRLLILG